VAGADLDDRSSQRRRLAAVQAAMPAGEDLEALAAAVRAAHGDAVEAVLYYGSCLRSGRVDDGIADFYVLVGRYRDAGMGWLRAGLNRLLPPNVFYLEHPRGGRTLRAKYAVISTQAFLHGVRGEAFLPYLWGRFAQPSGILWSRSAALSERLRDAQLEALQHVITEVLPLMPATFDSRSLWETGLLASYATELRAERSARIRALYDHHADYYAAQTADVLRRMPEVESLGDDRYRHPASPHACGRARRRWAWRRWTGKAVSVLRLVKSLLTFRGAVDYAAWKIERHSGSPVEVPDWARRWPLLGGWVILWRLLRRGSLR
jgi:hypothetical protein